MLEAKISLPRNPMCREAAEISEMCFPKAFTVIIPQMFVVYGISRRYCVASRIVLYSCHCLPNDKSTVFCLHDRFSNTIFQIVLDLDRFYSNGLLISPFLNLSLTLLIIVHGTWFLLY